MGKIIYGLKRLFRREPLVVREYDDPMVNGVKREIQKASHKFRIPKKKIDGLLVRLEEAGPCGIEKEKLREEITDPKLKNCFDELLQTLHDNYGGVLLMRLPATYVGLETAGRYYFLKDI